MALGIEDVARIAVDCGLYEVVLANALERNGLSVQRQKPISFRYADVVFNEGFRADL